MSKHWRYALIGALTIATGISQADNSVHSLSDIAGTAALAMQIDRFSTRRATHASPRRLVHGAPTAGRTMPLRYSPIVFVSMVL